ncbi:MAG: hypothetical protein KA715_10530 [Xanthomonadaceae bacterium]|nr:hypothetical protein [Xanthomonadaceae bacterium]
MKVRFRFFPYYIFFLVTVFYSSACDQGNDRLKEKADIESKVISQNQIDAEMAHLTQRSKEMEKDFLERQKFYQALVGTYEGEISNGYRIKITLASRLPNYQVPRIRMLEEITNDLDRLGLNAQIIQWLPNNNLSAIGCQVEMIKPDLVNGELTISSDNCPNLYKISISHDAESIFDSTQSYLFAQNLRINEEQSIIPIVYGEILPLQNPNTFTFTANRIVKNKSK